jgi:hypothetical protein
MDTYHKFKSENRSPEQITNLIEILQKVADREDYYARLNERIENYERKYKRVNLAVSNNL